jgi:hypothetical protein
MAAMTWLADTLPEEQAEPAQRAVDALLDRVQSLQARVDELERQAAERAPSRWSVADDLDEDEEVAPAPKRGGVKN